MGYVHCYILMASLRQKCAQCEDGSFEPILPRDDLEAIHSRILASELVVKGSAGGAKGFASQQGQFDANQPPLNVRLAAALGLTPLLLPFRCALLTFNHFSQSQALAVQMKKFCS